MSEHSGLGDLLRSLRMTADVTIEALAELSGVSDRTISDIERGVSGAPQHRTLVALADALRLDPDARESVFSAARTARSARRSGVVGAVVAPPPLRQRVTGITGRERELATALSLLSVTTAVAAPALVISGGPGSGKTATALELIGRTRRWPTTVVADLNGLGAPTSPTQLLQELLRQLPGGDERMPSSLDDAARRWKWLTARNPPLVLLDNAANEAQIRPVLALSARGAVVVTSRRSLAGLEGVSRITLGALDREASIRLLEREIPADRRHPIDIIRLAEFSDGMPLALRIAADAITRGPLTNTGDLVAALRATDDRPSAFVAGNESVAASIALSYDALDAPTAELFRDISVIDRESFDASLAAALSTDRTAEAWIVEARLDDLADQGLLEVLGGDRYRLGALMRSFAHARLLENLGEVGLAERLQRAASR